MNIQKNPLTLFNREYFWGYTILFLYFFVFVAAQPLPFFTSYSKSDHHGDNQTWSITQTDTGELFFANNRYLLNYNGANWRKFQLPQKTVIRSVIYHNGKVYCGTHKNFGFWKEQSSGEFRFTSISDGKRLFPDEQGEDIWRIFKWGKFICFQTFTRLFLYDEVKNTIGQIRFPSNITYSYLIDDKLFCSAVNGNIYVFEENAKEFQLVCSLPENAGVVHAIHLIDNVLWIFTYKDGVYQFHNNRLKKWDHSFNQLLKDYLVNTVVFYRNLLIFGTVNNGVLIFNTEKQTYYFLNKEKGLPNNTVLSNLIDKEENIWFGLENGLLHLELNSPIKQFNDQKGILGGVHDITFNDEKFWLATNHGLFTYDDAMKKVGGISGLIWSLTPIDDELICGANDGTYSISMGNIRKINNITGGWKFKKVIGTQYYVQSTYTGLYLYQKKNAEWVSRKISKMSKPMRDISLVIPNYVFASGEQSGLYAFRYNEEFSKVDEKDLLKNLPHLKNENCFIVNIKQRPYFLIGNQWFEFNTLDDKLYPCKKFNDEFPETKEAYTLNDEQFITVTENSLFINKVLPDGTINKQPLPKRYYYGKLIPLFSCFKIIHDEIFIGMDDGFLVFKQHQLNPKKILHPNIQLWLNNKPISSEKEIPLEKNSLILELSSGKYGFQSPIYFYDIDKEQVKRPVDDQKIDLTMLTSGKYKITIYQFVDNTFLPVVSTQLVIENPWYLSFWFGMVLLFSLVLAFYIYRRFQLIKHQNALRLAAEEAKFQSEIEILKQKEETEKAKLLLEKKSIEIDFKSKTNELAAKALMLSKYQEWEEEIKKLASTTTDENIKKKLNSLIRKNPLQKEWEVFESNVNVVHQDFITRLLKAYPNLTPKDIQLAVLLRMNLSSKEIAPIMSITPRGVEIHRYRLRKKILLDKDENLAKFFINF